MKVASAIEMNQIDRSAQEDYGIPGAILMERAALALLKVIKERFDLSNKKVHICCGKGNNGGDGLALARLLLETAAEPTAVLAFERAQYRGLSLANLHLAEKYGVRVVDWENFNPDELKQTDLIVDALLGTGSSGAPGGVIAALITSINDSGKPVISVDLPSGIDVNTGAIKGNAVKASITVTFGLPKPGLLVYPGAEAAGDLVVESIGFPRNLLESAALKLNWPSPAEVRELIPKRSPTAHKGTAGHVLAIGGAAGMTGAIALCSLGALRAGAGLVTAGIQDRTAFPEKPAEVMAISWTDIFTPLEKFQAVVFGPGVSVREESRDLLLRLLENCKAPAVIDADGLNILATYRVKINNPTLPLIFTPHPGEMSRLTGLPVSEIQANRIEIARRYAEQWGVILVLKGARSIIADPQGNIFINSTGNPGMATAGMGDALAGIIGGFLAQGLPPLEAAVAGTYLHGLAGDLAAERIGPTGIITTDLLKEFPTAVKKVLTYEQIQGINQAGLGRGRPERNQA